MATDQEIRDRGIKFLPQQKYLQSPYQFTEPVAEEKVTESFGIPNTNAFNNSGGNDFSVYNPDPNSIINRNYQPNYDYRRFSEPDQSMIEMGRNQDYFYKPEPTGPQKFLQFASSFMPGAGAAGLISPYLPVNRRRIMENELGGKGIMVNNIGQIVAGNSGSAYDPSGANIMAGYNAYHVDQDTFDKRRAKAKKNMSEEGFKKFNIALTAAEKNFLDADDESEDIYNFKKKQKQVKRDKTVVGRYLNKRDRVALAKKQINPTGPSNSKRGTPGGSADNFNGGTTYDNSGGDFRNADGSNVNQNFSTPASVSNYDPSVLYARGGRVGYFFGGRVNFKDGGLASIL